MTSERCAWVRPPAGLHLEGDDVHVWLVPLECSASALGRLLATLSADERERADRFCFERDRRHYVCARGVLRHILAGYLGLDPAALGFEYGGHGKPTLASGSEPAIAFNVSHSGELALLAFSRRGDLGVDIEAIRPMTDGEDIASRFFSAGEAMRLQSLPAEEREAAFFRCWTRKEAYVKAVGDGLARPLDGFDVTFAPGEPVRLVIAGDDRETRRWTLRSLEPGQGYEGALVMEGRRRLSCWGWAEGRIPVGSYAKEAV